MGIKIVGMYGQTVKETTGERLCCEIKPSFRPHPTFVLYCIFFPFVVVTFCPSLMTFVRVYEGKTVHFIGTFSNLS